jgi:hypothetical protein
MDNKRMNEVLKGSIEEKESDPLVDTEEQVVTEWFKVPTTPGSVYGGSRNIMKNTIHNNPLIKYFNGPSNRDVSPIHNMR